MPQTRREFLSTVAATTLSATALVGVSGTAMAAGGYELVNPPQNTSSSDTVEVLEFLWLGCPHCYAFEPTIAAWEENMPENVTFVREAPPLNPAWEQHSRGFYAAQVMGHETHFVNAMFKAIHEDKKRMRKPADIAKLASTLGMDEDKFLKTMNSFAVQTKLNRSLQLAKGAGVSGVPSIMINGKYRTGASIAGGNAAIIDVINERIDAEKLAMGIN